MRIRFMALVTVVPLLCAAASGSGGRSPAAATTRAQESPGKPLSTLEGKLVAGAAQCPLLRTPKGEWTLTGKTTYLLHTLQDERLRGRELRVEGAELPGNTFQVQKFYTVRDGKLYRVRYYCEVCNIEALEPGNCVCCQQPTELQEIPVVSVK